MRPEDYLDAAKAGASSSQHNLGLCYLFGRGTAVNVPEGLKWLERSASQNNGASLSELGQLYCGDKSVYGFPIDYEKAVQYLEKSLIIETRNVFNHSSQWSLGKLYAEGKGVDQDLVKAISLVSESTAKINVLPPQDQREREMYLEKLHDLKRAQDPNPELGEKVITVILRPNLTGEDIEVRIKAKKKTLLSKVLQAFADTKGISSAILKALGPEGDRLKKDLTLRENGLEDEDTIDIVQDLDGGF